MNGYLNITKNSKTEILNSDRLIKFLNNKDNQIINKKNIYILVYESYANLETIDHYGFDNRHMKFLEIKGFKIIMEYTLMGQHQSLLLKYLI